MGIVASDVFNSAVESTVSGESVRIKFEPFWLTTDRDTSEKEYRNISQLGNTPNASSCNLL